MLGADTLDLHGGVLPVEMIVHPTLQQALCQRRATDNSQAHDQDREVLARVQWRSSTTVGQLGRSVMTRVSLVTASSPGVVGHPDVGASQMSGRT